MRIGRMDVMKSCEIKLLGKLSHIQSSRLAIQRAALAMHTHAELPAACTIWLQEEEFFWNTPAMRTTTKTFMNTQNTHYNTCMSKMLRNEV
jgi:hypothetical protein